MPEFQSANKTANYLANHNRLSFSIVAASGDLFNMGSNQNLTKDNADRQRLPASAIRRP